jgi:cytochrome c-type biogenesis protein CcmF
MKMGDTLYYSTGLMVLNDVVSNPNIGTYNFAPTDTAIMAEISVINSDGRTYKARPVFYYKDGQPRYAIDTVFAQGLAIGLSGIDGNNRFLVNVKESSSLTPFIALKVLQFPYINLVWLGTIIMVAGFVMSVVRRVKLLKGNRA